MRNRFGVLGVSLLVLAAASCAGDPAKLVKTNGEARAKIMGAIASDSALIGRMADTLLVEDRARAVLVEKVATHGEAMQTLMMRIARDPVAMDGIIGFAMQESTMKAHVLTLLRGIQLSEASRATP